MGYQESEQIVIGTNYLFSVWLAETYKWEKRACLSFLNKAETLIKVSN